MEVATIVKVLGALGIAVGALLWIRKPKKPREPSDPVSRATYNPKQFRRRR